MISAFKIKVCCHLIPPSLLQPLLQPHVGGGQAGQGVPHQVQVHLVIRIQVQVQVQVLVRPPPVMAAPP